MSEALLSETAVTTQRSAETLAQLHGFESLDAFVDSLPQDARVLDIGAGVSTFGRDVAKERPDITWVNFDFSYLEERVMQRVTQDPNTPPNLLHIAGDAKNIDGIPELEPESFDAVLSYWLLPHISLDGKEGAAAIAANAFRLARPGALLSLGPADGEKKFLPTYKSGNAIQRIKYSELGEEEYASWIAEATYLHHPIERIAQKAVNATVAPYFGTSQYYETDAKTGKRKVLDPHSGELVDPVSVRGARIAGELGFLLGKSFVSEVIAENEDSKLVSGAHIAMVGIQSCRLIPSRRVNAL
jgi:Methyltransferase domain